MDASPLPHPYPSPLPPHDVLRSSRDDDPPYDRGRDSRGYGGYDGRGWSDTNDRRDGGGDDGYGRRRYRHGPRFPIWLVILFVFLFLRPSFFWGMPPMGHGPAGVPGVPGVPGVMFAPNPFAMLLPLLVFGALAFFVMRLALPLVGGAVRPLLHRSAREHRVDAPDSATDSLRVRRLELDLIDANRQIRALEEKVAWQSKLLDIQPVQPAPRPRAPESASGDSGDFAH